ncbi:MAG TPA: hypothetical protein VHB46_09180 [Burkholderiales bacterium]|nr:hypothetical protein [Burkholderiales bacterium]
MSGRLWSAASIAALAFLAAMLITGALPQQRQLVRSQAAGVLELLPEKITRVELESTGRVAAFSRNESGWAQETKGPIDPAVAEKLSMAVQVMHTSAPVRVMASGEYRDTDLREFGLEKPDLSIALYQGPVPVLRAHFGGLTPDKYLRYMTVDGQQQLFLMSLFVGDMWAAVAASTFAR